MVLSQGKVEKFSGLPGPPLVHRSQEAENSPLVHRLTEEGRLVPRMAQGIWEPSLAATEAHSAGVGNSPLGTSEPRLSPAGGQQKGVREPPLVGGSGAPESAFGWLLQGGLWVQARALRL